MQPIMPLIEYNVNKDYIVNVLCENRNKPELACGGKCYLNKKIEKSSHSNSHDHSIPQIDLSKYPVSLLDKGLINIDLEDIVVKSKFVTPQGVPKNFSFSIFRPPIYSV